MRFLFFSDGGLYNTSMFYINRELNNSDDHQSLLVDPSRSSVYMTIDTFNPDIVISSAASIPMDLVQYLTKEKQNIKLILFSNSMTNKQNLTELKEALKRGGVDLFKFFTTEYNDSKYSALPHVRISNGFDPAILEINKKYNYSHPSAIYAEGALTSSRITNISKDVEFFHILMAGYQTSDTPEHLRTAMIMPYASLSSLFTNYEEIIFTNLSNGIPQAFFDSVAMGLRVYHIGENEKEDEKMNLVVSKVLGDFDLNYRSKNKLSDFSSLKKTILENHNASKRVKSFLSQVPKIKENE